MRAGGGRGRGKAQKSENANRKQAKAEKKGRVKNNVAVWKVEVRHVAVRPV